MNDSSATQGSVPRIPSVLSSDHLRFWKLCISHGSSTYAPSCTPPRVQYEPGERRARGAVPSSATGDSVA